MVRQHSMRGLLVRSIMHSMVSYGMLGSASPTPAFLSFFEPGIQQKMHALFEDCADGGEPIMDAPEDIGDDDRWGFEISEMWVKMQEGPMMSVPTLPYVMKHLPRCKGKGPCGDVYEHYQAMPQDLVHDMCHRALNGRISEGFATLWRSGLLHIGDKERLDSRGLKDGRPITAGLALRRITGRIPCAQLKETAFSWDCKNLGLGLQPCNPGIANAFG